MKADNQEHSGDILVVDDNPNNLKNVESLLQEKGYHVRCVDSGSVAILVARRQAPELLLLDVLMPDMDGFEVCELLKKDPETADFPIIFLSALDNINDHVKGFDVGAVDFITKPIKPKELYARVKTQIELYRSKMALKKRSKQLEMEIEIRKKIEVELQQAKVNAEKANFAKTEFLSNISHEIRTPMHQILSYSKFGIEKFDIVNKEKLHHYFSKIRAVGQNLLSLLNDLLDLSKLESGKVDYDMQTTSIQKIINNIIDEFHSLIQEKDIAIEKTNQVSNTMIICDEVKISQVLRNLFSNAIKFSVCGNKIFIDMKTTKMELDNGSFVEVAIISISDQGVGIPVDELDSVFDKFVQSSKSKIGSGGTGLGLAICKEIIAAHNGNIWAKNNPEGGATFTFMLPYNNN